MSYLKLVCSYSISLHQLSEHCVTLYMCKCFDCKIMFLIIICAPKQLHGYRGKKNLIAFHMCFTLFLLSVLHSNGSLLSKNIPKLSYLKTCLSVQKLLQHDSGSPYGPWYVHCMTCFKMPCANNNLSGLRKQQKVIDRLIKMYY